MSETLKLSNSIMIDGKRITQLNHNADEITPPMFAEAEARKMRASGSKGGNLSGAVELDYGLHLYLGFAAIQAANPNYDITDLERIKGRDVVEVMKIGRNFIVRPAASSQDDESGELSETMPAPSTPQSATSKEKVSSAS